MKKRRTYKHTEKYLKKKAEKERLKSEALARKRAEKQLEIKREMAKAEIIYLFLIYAYLNSMYGISEIEMLFGSNDAFLQKRILVARQYLREIYEEGRRPNFEGLDNYFQDHAIEEYCRALGVDTDVYNTLSGTKQREIFLQKALDYTYNFAQIEDNVKKSLNYSKEEFNTAAKENYEEAKKLDLRKGSTGQRKAKRFEIAKIVLQYFEDLENGTLSARELAKEKNINRNTLNDIYKKVKNLLRLGMKIDEDSFYENKRGRKPKENSIITDAILMKLEKDLEDLPGDCGLSYASWTGAAIKEYLKTFYDLDVSMPYLYNFLRVHDIVSKSASRRNPNASPEEIAEFKRTLYKKFRYAIKHNLIVLFLDETQVQQGARTRGYAKKGKDAVYSYHTENLHCAYTLLTLIGLDFVLIFKHEGTLKSEDYVKYLEELHKKYPEQKFLIFRDNARIHTSDEVTESLKKSGTDKYIEFESIPAYCPELNPVELMNNEFKAELKKYACTNKHEVVKHAKDFIEKFQDAEKNSKHVGRRKARQYFKGKECSFIFDEYLRAMKDVRKKNLENRKLTQHLKAAA